MSVQKYIPLNRSFSAYQQNEGEQFSFNYDRTSSTWDQVLAHPYVVILGHAGAGKTTELEKCAERFSAEGREAFFCTAWDVLAENHLIKSKDKVRFNAAKAAGKALLFFIDSLDEGNLSPSGAKIETLFENLYQSEELNDVAPTQIHWVVSARLYYWEQLPDQHKIEDYCVALHPQQQREEEDRQKESKTEPNAKIYNLSDLDYDQTKGYCQGCFEQGEGFFQVLVDMGYINKIIIPRQLNQWYAYWNQNGSFGTRQERLQFFSEESIDEHNEILQEPGISKPLELAKRLAASIVLCERNQFGISIDESEVQKQHFPLDSSLLLPELEIKSLRTALLNRTLFSEYNTGFSFIDTEIRDYLAATWIFEQSRQGYAVDLLAFFFKEFEIGLVVNSKVPEVVTWIAQLEQGPRFFQRLLQAAPHWLLMYGDPQLLTVQHKKKILEAICQAPYNLIQGYRIPSERMLTTNGLREPYLIPFYRELIESSNTPAGLKEILLKATAEFCAFELVDLAEQIVMDQGGHYPCRSAAIKICAKADDQGVLERLRGYFLKHQTSEMQQLKIDLLKLLYPSHLCVAEVVDFFKVGDLRLGNTIMSEEDYLVSGIVQNSASEDLLDLFNGLASLCTDPKNPSGMSRSYGLRKQFEWLHKTLGVLCEKLYLEWDETKDISPLGDVVKILSSLRRDSYNTEWSLESAYAKKPELRRKLLLQVLWVEENKNYGASCYSALHLQKEDLEWLIPLIGEQETVEQNISIWNIAKSLSQIHLELFDYKDILLEQSLNHPQLHHYISSRFDHQPSLRPAFTYDDWQINREKAQQKKDKKVNRIIGEWLKQQKSIETDEKGSLLRKIYRYLRLEKMILFGGGHIANFTKEKLQFKPFELSQAFLKGLVLFFEHHQPSVIGNRTPEDDLALIACQWIALNKGMETLNAERAKKALYLGFVELNSMPWWWSNLAAQHPDSLRAVLPELFKAELSLKAKDENKTFSKVIRYFSFGSLKYVVESTPPAVKEQEESFSFAPEAPLNAHQEQLIQTLHTTAVEILWPIFKEVEPEESDILAATLSVLFPTKKKDLEFLTLIQSRIDHSAVIEEGTCYQKYWGCWLRIDHKKCWEHVKGMIPKDKEEAQNFLELIFQDLYFEPANNRQDWMSTFEPKLLTDMLSTFVDIFPYEEDPRFESVVMTSREREGRGIRNRLLDTLASHSQSIETYQFLLSLFDDPRFKGKYYTLSDYLSGIKSFLYSAEPWDEQNILEFEQLHTKTPKTSGQFFHQVLNRVELASDQLLNGDFAPEYLKRLLRSKDELPEDIQSVAEVDFQIWLAGQLNHTSNGYHTGMEEMKASRQRKDIIVSRSTESESWKVVVEAKLIFSTDYSLNSLKDALSNQLVGRYLDEGNRSFKGGILWIINNKNKTFEANGGLVKFEEVCNLLNAETEQIRLDKDLAGLHVIGVDLVTNQFYSKGC